MALSLSEANLISAFVESVLFGMRAFVPLFIGAYHVTDFTGLFTIIYVAAVYILRKKWRRRANTLALIVSTVMYILGIMVCRSCYVAISDLTSCRTQHLAVSLQRIINAFLKELNTPGGANAYLGEVANKTYVFQVAVYQVQTLIGDAFIVGCFLICILGSHILTDILRLIVCMLYGQAIYELSFRPSLFGVETSVSVK